MTGITCVLAGQKSAAAVARTAKTITVNGSAQVDTAQSKFGGASLLCDGTTDFLITESTSDFAFGTSQYTVEGWLRINSTGKQHSFFDLRAASGNDWVLYVNTSNKLELFTGSTATDANAITTGVWYHIAVVRDSSNIKVYRDGTEVLSLTAPTISGNRQLRIGGGRDGGSFPNTDLNGWMDEIRVSNTARYTAAFTAPTAQFVNDSNTLLLLHCNGTDASTTFTDDTGVRKQLGISAIGNAQVDTAQSKFGGASAQFDGTGDYLTIGNNGDYTFGTGDFTFECWVRYTSLATFATVCDFRVDASSNAMALYFNGGTLRVYTNGADRITSSGITFSTNTWYHLAVCRSGTDLKLFVNGTQRGSTYTDSTNYSSSNKLAVGANYDFNAVTHWNGWIDEIRLSTSARYTANFTEPTAAFTNDSNTVLLIHANGTDASTTFTDDNA
jgi:hypothetical protein